MPSTFGYKSPSYKRRNSLEYWLLHYWFLHRGILARDERLHPYSIIFILPALANSFPNKLFSLSFCSLLSYRYRSPPLVSSSTLFLLHLFFSVRLSWFLATVSFRATPSPLFPTALSLFPSIPRFFFLSFRDKWNFDALFTYCALARYCISSICQKCIRNFWFRNR